MGAGSPLSHREGPGRAVPNQVPDRASSWVRERFGDRADAVRRQLAASLLEVMGNAQDAQSFSHSDKRYTYGFTMMARRYETLAEGLHHEPIPPPAAFGPVSDLWTAEPGAASSFDDGLVPALALSTRSPTERKNDKIFPVSSETPEETAVTGDNEQP